MSDVRRQKRREGDWFSVCLPDGRFVLGLLARAHPRGQVVFGYFFGPPRREPPQLVDITHYSPQDALLVGKFLDENLTSGRWPIIGRSPDWDRSAWPMPEFAATAPFLDDAQAVTLDEDNPNCYVTHRQISKEEASKLPPDEIWDAMLLENRLARALGIPPDPSLARLDLPPSELEQEQEGVRHVLFVPRSSIQGLRRTLSQHGYEHVQMYENVEMIDDGEDSITVEILQRGEIAQLQRSVDETEEQLTKLAERLGGIYDGREWSLGAT